MKPKKNRRSLKKKFESKLIKDHHTENKEKTSRDVNTNDVLNETVNDSVSKTLMKTVQNTNNKGIKDNVYSNFQIENKSENKTEVLEGKILFFLRYETNN